MSRQAGESSARTTFTGCPLLNIASLSWVARLDSFRRATVSSATAAMAASTRRNAAIRSLSRARGCGSTSSDCDFSDVGELSVKFDLLFAEMLLKNVLRRQLLP